MGRDTTRGRGLVIRGGTKGHKKKRRRMQRGEATRGKGRGGSFRGGGGLPGSNRGGSIEVSGTNAGLQTRMKILTNPIGGGVGSRPKNQARKNWLLSRTRNPQFRVEKKKEEEKVVRKLGKGKKKKKKRKIHKKRKHCFLESVKK